MTQNKNETQSLEWYANFPSNGHLLHRRAKILEEIEREPDLQDKESFP
ncbi:hypothetical protein [Lysinibacillus sp. CTST325]